MALPHDLTALEEFLDDLLFSGAYFSATKGFAEEGRAILDRRGKVIGLVQGRNEQRDEQVKAFVRQAIAWDAMRGPLESFERQVDGHFDQDRKGYQKVFSQTVNALRVTTMMRREAALKPIIAFASQKSRQGKLAETGKALVAAWSEYLAATAATRQQADVITKVFEAVSKAKHDGVVAMREADGAARSAYSDDPGQARKFFRNKGSGKVDLEAEAKKLEAVAAKAVAAAQAARAKADKARAEKDAAPPPKKPKLNG